MKKIIFSIILTIIVSLPFLALAHGDGTEDMAAMMGWGNMMGSGAWAGSIFMSLLSILIVVAIIALIVWISNQMKK